MTLDALLPLIIGVPTAIGSTITVMRWTGRGLGSLAASVVNAQLEPRLSGLEENITKAVCEGMGGKFVEKAEFQEHVERVDKKFREVRREIHQALAANGGD